MFGVLIFLLLLIIHFFLTLTSATTWENSHIICPNQCMCQYERMLDLSIGRWTEGLKVKHNIHQFEEEKRNNDVYDENDSSTNLDENPFMKYAICMIQNNGNGRDIIDLVPQDVQALVLLFNTDHTNITLETNDFILLTDLIALEIRGTNNVNGLKFLLDEPMPFIKYANFEKIELIGSETTRKMQNSIHPSEVYEYVPESERMSYNISFETDEEVEIVPYDVYLIEQKESKLVSFIGWSDLMVLRVHNCKLNELRWETFLGLENLKHLSLERNDIKAVPPFAFYGAMHIQTLSLANNKISQLNYRSLAGLLELEWLNLNENSLTKLSEQTFPPLPRMKTVDFRNNPIRHIFPLTFSVMNNTQNIFIGDQSTPLEFETGSSFQALSGLKTLFISNASAVILQQQIFKDLKKIEFLKIQGNIPRIEFDAFVEMPNIRELILSECNIEDISMDIFYGLKNLEIIDLSKNKIKWLPYGIFDEQRKIKEVYLQGNQLAELPNNLFKNPLIKLMRLTQNPWYCSCDMLVWNQDVTNSAKSLVKQEKCFTDPDNHKNIKCVKMQADYIYDNKLSPRCEGSPDRLKHQSVYYALRKSLKCNVDNNHHGVEKRKPNKISVNKKKQIITYLKNKGNLEKYNYKKNDLAFRKNNVKNKQKDGNLANNVPRAPGDVNDIRKTEFSSKQNEEENDLINKI